ncbi:MAG: ribonuclease Z [Nanoarchaeota archaeon]|nr:ribonuclease Z [Nanoarchaeota archaeon]MBU1322386.1 ribonuclease Z [Nanoarchaeota archaeon]MBU1596939.1 ribonuclease Z [Nanoarchaeota archaeon]MBU2442344.1 ribonuclease Z [Nanoarchaeota archaeon]
MEIIMLGTSCMVPTKERNVQSIYVEYKGEGILIDCGEGTQRQMNIAGINRNKVRKILISHWHGDHVGGLIGLLQTISNNENPQKVTIYGPKETKERIFHLLKAVSFENNRIEIEINELNPKGVEKIFENNDYYIECASLDHRMPCLGYSIIDKDKRKINMAKVKKIGLKEGPQVGKLQRGQSITFKGKTINPDDVSHIQTGKKLSVVLDTQPCTNAYNLAKDADLLIAESAYTSDLEEKGAEYKHMTTKDAGLIATRANVKELIITHFSQRYKTDKELKEEIKTFFQNSRTAHDFMKVKL